VRLRLKNVFWGGTPTWGPDPFIVGYLEAKVDLSMPNGINKGQFPKIKAKEYKNCSQDVSNILLAFSIDSCSNSHKYFAHVRYFVA